MNERPQIFDFDNHYYEAEDAFTRHQDRAMRNRGVRWAEIDGRRRLLVGGNLLGLWGMLVAIPITAAAQVLLAEWYRGDQASHFFEGRES